MKFPSLHSYLDAQLPTVFAIKLRNFFSFLLFVSSVDKRIQDLRYSVNRAKADPQSYDYLVDYQNNELFFAKEFSSEHSFQFSDAEQIRAHSIQTSKTGSAGDDSYIQTTSMLEAATSLGDGIPQRKKESRLKPLLECLQVENWKEPVDELFNSLGSEKQRFKLIRELIADTNAVRTDNKKQCVLYLISLLSLGQDDLKKQLFEDLQNEKAIDDYDYYLSLQGDVLRGRLIGLIGALGKKQVCGEVYNYGVQREFQPVKRALGLMCKGEAFQEIESAVDNTSRCFDSWKEKNNLNNDAVKQLVGEIASCLAGLKEIIQLFKKEDCLQRKHREEQIADRKNRALQEEREEFNKQIRNHELTWVSRQRIAELYPNEAERDKKIQQCEKLFITVFDAKDQSAREEAIREHRLMKGLC